MRLDIPASSSAVWGVKVRLDAEPALRIAWPQNSASWLRLLALTVAMIKSMAVLCQCQCLFCMIRRPLDWTNHMEPGREFEGLLIPDERFQQKPGLCESDSL